MRAAICVRVSPRPQDKVRYSPEIQEQKCREWCEANGHEVVTVIRDILVSGGAANRFDSIYATLDTQPVDLFVVSDLSRWTRDEPELFWFVKRVLSDKGVQLASVDEPWLGSDMPFSATVTTAKVEANYQERLVLKRKTSAGVRAARAAGKRWGRHFGWTWDPEQRRYDHDVERITALYEAWVAGDPAHRIGQHFGLHSSHVRRTISAIDQRAIVGDDLWLRAQARPLGRSHRSDAALGNVYRGLLFCPFCGHGMIRPTPRSPHAYGCRAKFKPISHPWRFIDVRRSIRPQIEQAIAALRVPEEEIRAAVPPVSMPAEQRDIAAEIERLSMAWVRGRISEARYEKAMAELEAERDVPPPPPVEAQVEMARWAEEIDLDAEDVEQAALLNRVLRELLTITLLPDPQHIAKVVVRPPYDSWAAA